METRQIMEAESKSGRTDYKEYLKRLQKNDDRPLPELHALALSKEVGLQYGLTEEELKQIGEELEGEYGRKD